MSRLRKIGVKNLIAIVGLCSLSSTITIIPDILTLFSVNYVGYTVIPIIILVLTVLILPSTKIFTTEKFVLSYSIVFFLLYIVGLFSGLLSGSKSLVSGGIFLGAFFAFVVFANSPLFKKYYKQILKFYINAALLISGLVTLTFIILATGITNVDSWMISWPFNEKFALKFEKFGKAPFSYIGYLSLILTNTTKATLGLALNPFGDFCGLSYETSLGLLYSSVGFLFSLDFYKKKRFFFLLIFISHMLLGFSLTNMSSIIIIFSAYLYLNGKIYYKLFLAALVISIFPIAIELYLTLDFVEYKLNSRSYDDSVGSVFSLFKGGVLGEGVFTANYSPGILSSLILVVYYGFIIRIMLMAYSKRLFGIALGLSYTILHSLKFPFIYIQLPFSFWIPLLGYYYVKYYTTFNPLSLPLKAGKGL